MNGRLRAVVTLHPHPSLPPGADRCVSTTATGEASVMLALLHLLSSIALLVWGTHIVRTGIMRVYGSRLRRLLGHSLASAPLAFGARVNVTALVQSSNAVRKILGEDRP